MEKIRTIINYLEQIRGDHRKIFSSLPNEKVFNDTGYGELYKACWNTDFRLKHIIGFLHAVEKNKPDPNIRL